MTKEEAKKMGATHYRNLLFFKQYFRQHDDNTFWYRHESGFWFYYDSEKPMFVKPL